MNNEEVKKLVKACCEGDISSRHRFQLEFGELIYNFSFKGLKISEERVGDFYLYVFDKDRIFKRLENFSGERISAERYLCFFVLRGLEREWNRCESAKTLKMDEIDDIDSPCSHEKIHHKESGEGERNISDTIKKRESFCELFEKEEFFILKLLYIYDLSGLSLSAEDIRKLSYESGKSISDVIAFVAKLQQTLAKKAEQKDKLRISRDNAFFRILSHHANLIRTEESIAISEKNKSFELGALKAKKDDLKRKLAKRLRQINTIAEENPDGVITTPYKDIADFLGITVGAVSGRIDRARKKFALLVQKENLETQSKKESE